MADFRSVIADFKDAQRTTRNAAQQATRDAVKYMKSFDGPEAEAAKKWELFTQKIRDAAETDIRLEQFLQRLRSSEHEFREIQGNDFAPLQKRLESMQQGIVVAPEVIDRHALVTSFRESREEFETASMVVADDGRLGECPLSQESLDNLDASEVYVSNCCPHKFSKAIFAIFSSRASRAPCPVGGCGKSIVKSQLRPMTE